MEIERGRGLVRHFLPEADEYSASGVKRKVHKEGFGWWSTIALARATAKQAPVAEVDEIHFEEAPMGVRVGRRQGAQAVPRLQRV